MISNILTEEELCPIAGHFTRQGLRDWLHANGIPFVVSRSNFSSIPLLKYNNDCGLATRMNAQHATEKLEVKGTT